MPLHPDDPFDHRRLAAPHAERDGDGEPAGRAWWDDPDALDDEATDEAALDDDDALDDGDEDVGPADADEAALLDEDFPLGDGVADVEADVACPYCGAPNTVALDPGGGSTQEYVEDCQVCCQPWRVTVTYQPDGSADVWLDAADGR